MIWRIRDRSTFVELRRRGSRIRRGPIIVTYLPGTEAIPPRVAYAIGRHVGGAVARNQLRRRLRSIVSDLAGSGSVAPGSYLIGASAPATELSFSALSGHVTAAFAGAESSFQGGVAT